MSYWWWLLCAWDIETAAFPSFSRCLLYLRTAALFVSVQVVVAGWDLHILIMRRVYLLHHLNIDYHAEGDYWTALVINLKWFCWHGTYQILFFLPSPVLSLHLRDLLAGLCTVLAQYLAQLQDTSFLFFKALFVFAFLPPPPSPPFLIRKGQSSRHIYAFLPDPASTPCGTYADHLPEIRANPSALLSLVDHSPQVCILLPACVSLGVACALGHNTFFLSTALPAI